MQPAWTRFSENLDINDKGHLVIGQYDAVELAREYGTPLYVLDEDVMRANCRRFKQAMDEYCGGKGLCLFASKALCTMHTARVAAEEGLGADAVSGGEIYTLYKAGFPMDKVYFHGNNKTREEIELAIDCGVGYFIVDNSYELDMLNEIAGRKGVVQKILFRIKPGVDAHVHEYVKTGQIDSKFGVALENGEAEQIHDYAVTLENVRVDGVHCHIASGVFDIEPFLEAAGVMMDFVAKLRDKHGLKINVLNLGGGFGVAYDAEDRPLPPGEYIKHVAEAVKKLAEEKKLEMPSLVFEPGRAIVAQAGTTLYTVGGVKPIENVRTYVSVDGGMGDNPRYILYGAKYTIVLANDAGAELVAPVTVAGKCCESGDLIQEHVLMPEVKVGDILAVLGTGAYNYSMASNYNRVPRPPIVMLGKNGPYVAVRRETLDDLLDYDQ